MSLSSTQILILSLSSVALYCEHATRFQTDSVPVMVLHHSTITLSVDMLKSPWILALLSCQIVFAPGLWGASQLTFSITSTTTPFSYLFISFFFIFQQLSLTFLSTLFCFPFLYSLWFLTLATFILHVRICHVNVTLHIKIMLSISIIDHILKTNKKISPSVKWEEHLKLFADIMLHWVKERSKIKIKLVP